MIRSKLGFKALGLCVMAVCMMAVGMASVAQAEETGGTWHWKSPGGTTGTFSTSLEATVAVALENKTASLLFTTGGGTKVAILCTTAALGGTNGTNPGTLSANGEILLGKAKFSGCVTFLNGVLSKACDPHTGASSGVIETLNGKGLMLLHKLANGTKDPVILLEPETGTTTLVVINMGEECSIGEEVPVTGDLVVWDCKGAVSFSELKLTHLVEEFPALHNLVALGQPATISGSAEVTLTGGHLNYLWGGTAK